MILEFISLVQNMSLEYFVNLYYESVQTPVKR
jgi:hypothetical protein